MPSAASKALSRKSSDAGLFLKSLSSKSGDAGEQDPFAAPSFDQPSFLVKPLPAAPAWVRRRKGYSYSNRCLYNNYWDIT
jgi:hypothetical protein